MTHKSQYRKDLKINPRNSIVLASKSPYKKELIKKLNQPFIAVKPEYKEERNCPCSGGEYAEYLAEMKARSLLPKYEKSMILSSDQVLMVGESIFNKPGSFENAFRQLRIMANQTCVFYTGLAIYLPLERYFIKTYVTCEVVFRNLTDEQIRSYLKIDRPFNCAGSFMIEKAGVLLFQEIVTGDFFSLIGFPLLTFNKIISYYPHYDFLSLD